MLEGSPDPKPGLTACEPQAGRTSSEPYRFEHNPTPLSNVKGDAFDSTQDTGRQVGASDAEVIRSRFDGNYAMIKVRQQPLTIYQPNIRSVQVARFIRRMRLVGEGETRMLIAIEDDEGATLSVSLPIGRVVRRCQ